MFFYYFFWNFLARVEYERNSELKFCFLFLRPISSRFGYKYCWEEVLLFFEFFYYFLRNFLARVEYERNSGVKFFSLFLGLSHPVLAKYNIRMRFFKFFSIFFAIFFGIFLPWLSLNGFRD